MNMFWKTTCTFSIFCAVMVVAAPAQTFTSLLSFDGYDGYDPYLGSLVQGLDGNFYGTTQQGGHINCDSSQMGCGTLFRVTPGGTLTTVHKFCTETGCADGAYPYGGLVLGSDRSLYGTTAFGGLNGQGTIFKLVPSGKVRTLHSFNNTDGAQPYGTLIQGADGNFYGTTYQGGSKNYGTVFKVSATGSFTALYNFCAQVGCADGINPYAGLVQGTDGNFYGTTLQGGAGGHGTVFKMTSGGAVTTLHGFDVNHGGYPYGGLVQASDGNFYGTTESFGPKSGGTIFKITAQGTFTLLYAFSQRNSGTGIYPFDGLVQATDGNLYGTTSQGGVGGNFGTVFNFALGRVLRTLHSFDDTDGVLPYGGLVQGTDGSFYGTTRVGGADDYGTLFRLSMGLGPFVRMVSSSGRVGQSEVILGQGFTGASGVSFDGTTASFTIASDTCLTATVPVGATTGPVTVTTASGTLTSNKPFRVRP